MDIFIVVFLVFLNGTFALSEMALVSSKKAKLQKLIDDGSKGAAKALALHEDPTSFLSTVQIGITSIGVLNGMVGEAAFSQPLAIWLSSFSPFPSETNELFSSAFVVVVLTYSSIVVGELVPKRLALSNPESLACMVSVPMAFLSSAAKPFVWILSFSTNAILKMTGQTCTSPPVVTEEEIHAILTEGSEAGVIELQERDMVRNLFRLDDRQLASLMVPRNEMIYIDLNLPLEDNLMRVLESDHSRFPVCRGGLDDIVGFLTAKRLLAHIIRNPGKLDPDDVAEMLQPAVFVPETLTGMDLLSHFKGSGTQTVLVVNEYGALQGLVTLHDILEAVTGEFKPKRQEDAWAIRKDDGSWLIDGLIPIPELKDCLEIKESFPEEEKERYHTLSGLIMLILGRIPVELDVVETCGWRFEIMDMDGLKVDKIQANFVHHEEPPIEQ